MGKTGVCVVLMGAATIALTAATSQVGLPSNSLTPGATRKVTKEQICAPEYVASIKPVKDSLKEEAFARYGVRLEGSTGEVLDHLVPVELGGSDDLENLWPQPARGEWNATQKDALEQKLRGMVCDGTITLKQAQTAIRKDWVQAYTQYVTGGATRGQSSGR
jgi:hypothetical protein